MSTTTREQREAIRKESRNIYNRLRSIVEDSCFVDKVSARFSSLPLIANERCGSWYINPSNAYPQSVYFKSTDGHFGKWDFNLRRLNYHILPTICKHQGCIIVDSTRNGKRIPDSLAKTIPIWCAVINGAVAEFRNRKGPQCAESVVRSPMTDDASDWDTNFHSLPSVVSRSEHQQISDRIPGFGNKLLASTVNVESLSSIMHKPLRPIWITPSTRLDAGFDWADGHDLPFYPVILLSASEAVPDGMDSREGFTYVQGSADDHEMWAEGLDPVIFWAHHDEILSSYDAQTCSAMVSRILSNSPRLELPTAQPFHWLGETNIAVGSRTSGRPPECWSNFDIIVNCGALEYEFDKVVYVKSGRYLYLPIPEGKKGQHELFKSIPYVLDALKGPLRVGKRILFHCMQGRDRSVGLALALLVRYMDDRSSLNPDMEAPIVTKLTIQNRLLFIQSFRHQASPSRATMQRIKRFFMSGELESQQYETIA